MIRLSLSLLVLSGLLGCIGAGRNASPEKRTLLYGTFKVPNGFGSLRLQRQFSPLTEQHYLDEEGNFAFIDLPPGKYILAGFYKDGRFFSLHTMAQRFIFDLQPGEMKFAGAFEVVDFSYGGFGPGSFDIQEREEVAAEQVLNALLPGLEETQWAAKIRGGAAEQPAAEVAAPAPL